MAKVSAIITTHNRVTDLVMAIKSVRNQTCVPFECIVVDDASTDSTKEWMEKEQSEWLKYIRIEPSESRGGNHARNVGLMAANGEYVAYLDDDDIWLPEKIEKQIKIAEGNSDIGMVYCGRLYRSGTEDNDTVIIPDKYYTGDLSKKVFTKIIATTSTFFINKELLINVGGFDEELKFWQETEMMIRICQRTKVGCAFEPLVIYFAVPSSNRLSTKYYTWLDAVNYIKEKHKMLLDGLSEEERRLFEIMICNDAINRCNSSELAKERKKNLKRLYSLQKSPKNLIFYLMNISNREKAELLQKLNLFGKKQKTS
jgi:glycosyltransferase involved in cell wall biosynthesis